MIVNKAVPFTFYSEQAQTHRPTVFFVIFTVFFLVMNQYTTIFVVAITLAMKDKHNRNGAI